MATWSQKRKALLASIGGVVVVGAVAALAFVVLYNPPTCTDGIQNGKEQGVDCGGSCQKLCSSFFMPADVSWTRFEEVAPGLFNLAAYIVNPNTDGGATNVPFHFMLYDSKGMLITEKYGRVTIPPHRNTLAFVGAVDVGKRIPAKAMFEFTNYPEWEKKTDTLSGLVIGDKKYLEEENSSSLEVIVKNQSLEETSRITVYSVLYDGDSNAIGFARTVLDPIVGGGSSIAPFTWPISRNGKVISVEVLPVAE